MGYVLWWHGSYMAVPDVVPEMQGESGHCASDSLEELASFIRDFVAKKPEAKYAQSGQVVLMFTAVIKADPLDWENQRRKLAESLLSSHDLLDLLKAPAPPPKSADDVGF